MVAKYAIMRIGPIVKNLSIRGWVLDTCTSHCPLRARQGFGPSLQAETDVGSTVRLLSHHGTHVSSCPKSSRLVFQSIMGIQNGPVALALATIHQSNCHQIFAALAS